MTRHAVTPRCECGTLLGVRVVELIDQGTGPGGVMYACTACVPLGSGVLERPASTVRRQR